MKISNNRVVVTGGSGFLGTNVVEHFLEKEWEVTNFDILEPRNEDHQMVWEKVNLLDRDQLLKKIQYIQPSILLHLGARTDLDEKVDLGGYSVNIDGVYNILDSIQSTSSIQRVLFVSSQLVCKPGYIPCDHLDFRPTSLYGQSKVVMELIIRSAKEINAIWTIVRPTSIWGPWFDIPYKNFFLTIKNNMYFHIRGVSPIKQWGFVGNVVYQIWKIIQAEKEGVHGKLFSLADYSPVSLYEFANKVQVRMGAKPIRALPETMLKNVARLGDIAQFFGWRNPPLTSFRFQNLVTPELQDLAELEEIVGPLPFTLEQGIDMTVSWLENQ